MTKLPPLKTGKRCTCWRKTEIIIKAENLSSFESFCYYLSDRNKPSASGFGGRRFCRFCCLLWRATPQPSLVSLHHSACLIHEWISCVDWNISRKGNCLFVELCLHSGAHNILKAFFTSNLYVRKSNRAMMMVEAEKGFRFHDNSREKSIRKRSIETYLYKQSPTPSILGLIFMKSISGRIISWLNNLVERN